MSRFTVTLAVPASIPVPLGKTGKSTIIPVADFTQDVWEKAFVNGFVQALGDISRGYSDDKGTVPNTDEVWATARQKRVDSWKLGQWASIERGDSNMALVKDQYYFEALTERMMDKAKTDAEIKATVEANMPKGTKATFANFLMALGLGFKPVGADGDDTEAKTIAGQIEAALLERAMEAKAAREKAAAKIKVPTLDLNALLKKKA